MTCIYPLAMILAFLLSSSLFSFHLTIYTHFNSITFLFLDLYITSKIFLALNISISLLISSNYKFGIFMTLWYIFGISLFEPAK